jgi:hypothetical protein
MSETMERFIIERRGGIAGLKGRGEIAAEELDQSDRETLKGLFKGGKKLPRDEGADRYTYTVTRESDSGSKTVEVPETMMPRALTRIVKDQL